MDGELDVMQTLGTLVDSSLVIGVDSGLGEPRFVMLKTIHEFAAALLDAAPDADDMRRRHADLYLAMAVEGERHLTGRDQGVWLRRFEMEHGNLETALRWTLRQGKQSEGWWRHPQCGATTNSEGISPSEDRGWKDSWPPPAPTPVVPGRRRILRQGTWPSGKPITARWQTTTSGLSPCTRSWETSQASPRRLRPRLRTGDHFRTSPSTAGSPAGRPPHRHGPARRGVTSLRGAG